MKSLRKYSHLGLFLVVAVGIALAVLLSVQCVRTYLYVTRVLVPQEAEREAERQSGILSSTARNAGVADPHALAPILQKVMEGDSNHAIWMRLLGPDRSVWAEAGTPQGSPTVPERWWERVEKRESLGRLIDTPSGQVWVTMLPFRMPRPVGMGRPDGPPRQQPPMTGERPAGPPPDRRGGGALVLEIAIPIESATAVFSELRQNLVSGVLASLALLAAMAVISFRARNYLRGKYLEKELELARRVQSGLLPKAVRVSPHLDFAAAAMAADQVGGDFIDVFETGANGRVSLVLGDASGKGISSALLASVTQGAIRSSSGLEPETSCERINRMLCEKTASERFVTLFWGVYDPPTATLYYVNAGHSAPFLLRAGDTPERLNDGGPVLGLLAGVPYTCGKAGVRNGDLLIVYSDGINEATDANQEEFGDDRVLQVVSGYAKSSTQDISERVMKGLTDFAGLGPPHDDRTLLVVRFLS